MRKHILTFCMVAALGLAFLGAHSGAWADEINVNVDEGGVQLKIKGSDQGASTTTTTTTESSTTTTSSSVESGENYTLKYEAHPQKKTMIKLLAPQGVGGKVFNGKALVQEDEIPFSVAVAPEVFYKVEVQCPGKAWTRKIEAKSGQTAVLEVTCGASGSQPPANVNVSVTVKEPEKAKEEKKKEETTANKNAMSETEFAKLVAAVKAEDFNDSKVSVVKDAGAHKYFTCDQVGRLLDLYSFEDNRVEVAVFLYPRVVDPDNFYTVYQHFQFDSSKDEVREQIKKKSKGKKSAGDEGDDF